MDDLLLLLDCCSFHCALYYTLHNKFLLLPIGNVLMLAVCFKRIWLPLCLHYFFWLNQLFQHTINIKDKHASTFMHDIFFVVWLVILNSIIVAMLLSLFNLVGQYCYVLPQGTREFSSDENQPNKKTETRKTSSLLIHGHLYKMQQPSLSKRNLLLINHLPFFFATNISFGSELYTFVF